MIWLHVPASTMAGLWHSRRPEYFALAAGFSNPAYRNLNVDCWQATPSETGYSVIHASVGPRVQTLKHRLDGERVACFDTGNLALARDRNNRLLGGVLSDWDAIEIVSTFPYWEG